MKEDAYEFVIESDDKSVVKKVVVPKEIHIVSLQEFAFEASAIMELESVLYCEIGGRKLLLAWSGSERSTITQNGCNYLFLTLDILAGTFVDEYRRLLKFNRFSAADSVDYIDKVTDTVPEGTRFLNVRRLPRDVDRKVISAVQNLLPGIDIVP
jgi:hypothetical protein